MTQQEEINALRSEAESLRKKVKELEQKIIEMIDDEKFAYEIGDDKPVGLEDLEADDEHY